MGAAKLVIRVDCHAGYRGEEEPRRLFLGERRVEVVAIVDRWLGPDHRYFKLKGDDGDLYLIRYDEHTDSWELTQFERSGESICSNTKGNSNEPM
jgi:hypothetical protein